MITRNHVELIVMIGLLTCEDGCEYDRRVVNEDR